MDDFVFLLDDPSVDALRQLVRSRVYNMVTDSLQMDDDGAVAHSFSVGLPNREVYIVVESDWGETPRGTDFHDMSASICAEPNKVGFGLWEGRRVLQTHSMVRLRRTQGSINSIAVYTRDDSSDDEVVRYDVGLLFEYEDGRRFALTANESIAGGLRYTNKKGHLDALRADELRLVLE